jgi:hypothetical protein
MIIRACRQGRWPRRGGHPQAFSKVTSTSQAGAILRISGALDFLVPWQSVRVLKPRARHRLRISKYRGDLCSLHGLPEKNYLG